MEIWDLYDRNKTKLNKQVVRGEILKKDEYHLVVNVWIKNKEGKYLISQRAESRSFPLMWECTGGSIQAGEDSLTGAIREVEEELGITLNKNQGNLIGSALRHFENCPDILDVWVFESNVSIEDIKIQKEELNDVKWASVQEIKELYNEHKFEANAFFKEVLENKSNINCEIIC